MVRVTAPQTTSTIMPTDPDEQTILNDSAGTMVSSGPPPNDFLIHPNINLIEGINRDYEIPNLCTYKKIEALLEKMQDENTGLPIGSFSNSFIEKPHRLTRRDEISLALPN
ncbi:unnamed protein product, partial [Rotaria sp. Silwood1]